MSGYRHYEPIIWSIFPKTFRKSLSGSLIRNLFVTTYLHGFVRMCIMLGTLSLSSYSLSPGSVIPNEIWMLLVLYLNAINWKRHEFHVFSSRVLVRKLMLFGPILTEFYIYLADTKIEEIHRIRKPQDESIRY
jgi:hypothetical protein